MKTCKCCGKQKSDDRFGKMPFRKDGVTRQGDGLRTVCKDCAWDRRKTNRAGWTQDRIDSENERQQRYAREWDKRNPHAVKASKANLHTKRVGAVGRVSAQDVEASWMRYDGKCWVCGFPATEIDHYRPINRKSGGTNTADNILPICRECNQKRSHLWHGEVIAMKEAEMLKGLKELLHEAE